ncbi:galactose mutarotase [Acinetobacter sp. B5B]|uniref:aldose epimerase family protein n=1 Tax=Acinetobacter baretiae TaxID=2605383 RepID=UPI0018C226B0|nr:aldose epimerase family protein [Acinetobacter baretiae]MBF7682093.1 galactose mutarotase [Acinetobacter baretiae]MBF7684667.1 galactose mutarotase [Acinetobacter baretiae]
MKARHQLYIGIIAMAIGTLSHAATLTSQPYGTTQNGQKITKYTMTNNKGVSVSFIDFGAVITQMITPDAQGNKENIVLGFDNLHGYEVTDTQEGIHFGSLIGRYANRIGQGQFNLDGKTYQLEKNNAPNTLHGGSLGYDKRVWGVKPLVTQGDTVKAALTLTSPNGDQGFPGKLDIEVIYSLSDQNEFKIEYKANTDQPTVINLTNHSYFNLAGVKNTPYGILNHAVQIHADRILEVDKNSLPTGQYITVKDTPFDFTALKTVAKDIRKNNQQLAYGYGYDQTWVLNKSASHLPQLAAKVLDPQSKRTLEVLTTEPSIQFYTANHLHGNVMGRDGVLYRQADALALETQHFPDSPNKNSFPSTRLNPDQTYHSTTVYKFGIEK